MNIKQRNTDVLDIISKLDISPTMYKNAVEKYKNLALYIQSKGLDVDIFPQGSFSCGTIIRPYSRSEDRKYDLDFVCQVNGRDKAIGPKQLRDEIVRIIKSNEIYASRLCEYEECVTIEYADINEMGFSIDIVPAVNECDSIKNEMIVNSNDPDLISTSIAIPKFEDDNYTWFTNNPKGYTKWFMDINAPFLSVNKDMFRKIMYESNTTLYSTIDEIPSALERSAMQRVVQILKYHRDVYYSRKKDGDEIKPISAIISTLVANFSINLNPTIEVMELLKHVVHELNIYSNYQTFSYEEFVVEHTGKSVMRKEGDKWILENPANPYDNLTDKWNKMIAHEFFEWIRVVEDTLIDAVNLDDQYFRNKIEIAFGYSVVNKAWDNKYNDVKPTPINSSTAAKPWG